MKISIKFIPNEPMKGLWALLIGQIVVAILCVIFSLYTKHDASNIKKELREMDSGYEQAIRSETDKENIRSQSLELLEIVRSKHTKDDYILDLICKGILMLLCFPLANAILVSAILRGFYIQNKETSKLALSRPQEIRPVDKH